jgi:DsbC/DsbD-like thiol-disulfide interchange protein/cytochrome c biogenesis protein CcdA
MRRQEVSVAILRSMLMTVIALLFAASPLNAQTHITASLVAESSVPASGTSATIALQMQPAKGWHGYWLNPGEAGFATRLDWKLPKDVTVSTPRYPVPERLVVAGLMNHVFNGEHALLMQLTLPAIAPMGMKLPLRLSADWLACTDKICVPEHADLALDLTVGDGAMQSQPQFDAWRAKLPLPLGGDVHFQQIGKRVRFGIPFPQGARAINPWFFAQTENAILYPAVQTVAVKGDLLTVETDVSGPLPDKIEGILSIGDGKGLAITATPGVVPQIDMPINTPNVAMDWWTALIALGGAILGGLILNIMPCVFPIISLKALSLARAGGDEAAAKREALAYAVGVILTCTALGGIILGLRASGASVGWAFQLQNPYIIGFLLILASAITLNLAGLFHLRSFGGGDALAAQGGVGGAFWTGVLAAFVATPCTGPFMAAALGAALVLPTLAALAVFAGLGLGLALPFLALGYIPALRNRMPKPGAWMVTFQRILAVPMALTVVALAWLLWREISATNADQSGVISSHESALRFDEVKLADLRKDGKPVFLYFTADWCLTCKVNEKIAIEREEVKTAFKRASVVVMVGDWTNGDPKITRFLNAHGVSGVPLYLFYPGGKDASGAMPKPLPQVLTPGMLTALAQ